MEVRMEVRMEAGNLPFVKSSSNEVAYAVREALTLLVMSSEDGAYAPGGTMSAASARGANSDARIARGSSLSGSGVRGCHGLRGMVFQWLYGEGLSETKRERHQLLIYYFTIA